MTKQVIDTAARLEVGLAAAQAAVHAGGLVVLPTDTVYGIGCDAFSAAAVADLLAAKHRGRDMPPPVLVADTAVMDALAVDVPPAARALAQAHWPGPLTLVLKAQPALRMDLGDAGGTIAVRVPDHDVARQLLRRTGPLAVSSANVSGQPSATDCADAVAQLGESVAVYLDAGATPGETPSTIVDFASTPTGRILRQGALSADAVRALAPGVDV